MEGQNTTDTEGKTLFYPSNKEEFEIIKGKEIGKIREINLNDMKVKWDNLNMLKDKELKSLSIIYVDQILKYYVQDVGNPREVNVNKEDQKA